MTKHLLDSILKLFAIVAYTGLSFNYKKNLQSFIDSNISSEFKKLYTTKFKHLLSQYESASSPKKLSLNSVKLIKLCSQINSNALPEDRFKIVIYMLNFIYSGKTLEEEQKKFLFLIADLFEIPSEEINNLLKLIYNNTQSVPKSKLFNFYESQELQFTAYQTYKNNILIKTNSTDILINNKKSIPDSLYIVNYQTNIKTIQHKILTYKSLSLLFQENKNTYKLQLNVNGLSVKIKDKTLLHNTSFAACGGELVGIIGKSGAGKTTLIKAIAGINHNIMSGNISIEKNNICNYNADKSYVPQDCSFISGLTVEEHIYDRLSYLNIGKAMRRKIADESLKSVGLYEIKKQIVKKSGGQSELSGGQQKRLMIAMTLLQDPELILMDEPVSGLSSEETEKIIIMLKSIALKNKVVICSIHQPDIKTYNTFDKIIIIDEGGYPIYYGKPIDAAEYFRRLTERIDIESEYNDKYNPATILELVNSRKQSGNNVVRTISPKQFYDYFREEKEPLQHPASIPKGRKAIKKRPAKALIHFLKRELKILSKNPLKTAAYLIIPLLLGVFLSYISKFSTNTEYSYYYNPNVPAWILMILLSAILIGVVSTAHELIINKEFRKLENMITDTNTEYIFAIIIKVTTISLFQALLLSYIPLYILRIDFFFLEFTIIVWMLIIFGALTGLMLSAIFKTIATVYLLIPLIIIPQILFSGAIIDFHNFNERINNNKNVPMIASVVPMRWAAEAVITRLYTNNPYNKLFFHYNAAIHEAAYYLNFFIPEVEKLQNEKKMRKIILNEKLKNPFFPESIKNNKIDLSAIEIHYRNIINAANKTKDNVYTTIKTPNEKRKNYMNKKLSGIVRQSYNTENYTITAKEITRKYSPIYKYPDNNKLRSHYLTPTKKMLFSNIETYYFNLLIVKLINIIIFIFTLFYYKKSSFY